MTSAGMLKILVDTNVVIAAESVQGNAHPRASDASELYRLASELGHTLCIGRGTVNDLARHRDSGHRSTRMRQIARYHQLAPLEPSDEFRQRAGYPPRIGANAQVDLSLLQLLERGAAHWLVTDDRGLRAHAAVLGLSERVFSLLDALEILNSQRAKPVLLPSVSLVKGYELDPDDPIFDDFDANYDIRSWIRAKVGPQERPCLVMRGMGRSLDAVAILNEETEQKWGLVGRTLKVCTFKVAASARGVKRGELLLWAVFNFARVNSFDSLFVEVFAKEQETIRLLEDFGFTHVAMTHRENECVYAKHLWPQSDESDLDPLTFHVRYGPGAMRPERWFVVPIWPKWHSVLFPMADMDAQLDLFSESRDPGNAIRKAYVCRSNSRLVMPGDSVAFIRTRRNRGVWAVGVVEDTLRTADPAEVLSFTGRRTVYSQREIVEMCSDDGVIAMRFRLDRVLDDPITLEEMTSAGVVKRSPMSITRVVDQEAVAWLSQRVGA